MLPPRRTRFAHDLLSAKNGTEAMGKTAMAFGSCAGPHDVNPGNVKPGIHPLEVMPIDPIGDSIGRLFCLATWFRSETLRRAFEARWTKIPARERPAAATQIAQHVEATLPHHDPCEAWGDLDDHGQFWDVTGCRFGGPLGALVRSLRERQGDFADASAELRRDIEKLHRSTETRVTESATAAA